MYLKKLKDILAKEGKNEPFLCINDLIENGLSIDRFTDSSKKPGRHEITLFLSSWCKLIGFEPITYSDWLTNYCVDILTEISSSSSSQIRHSTKSTIKYIHRSDMPFSCNCENNIFKAICSSDCSLYKEQKKGYLHALEAEQVKIAEWQRIKESCKPDPETLPVTKIYKKQFDEAVVLIKQYLENGYMKKDIKQSEVLNGNQVQSAGFLVRKDGRLNEKNAEKKQSVSPLAIFEDQLILNNLGNFMQQ